MTRNPATIDQVSVHRATDYAIHWREDVIRRALQIVTDPDKKERLKKCECPACFYLSGRVGGSAMTSQPCGICKKDQMYGSTCTDALCMECAKEHELCKHCGADIHLRPRRKYEPLESR